MTSRAKKMLKIRQRHAKFISTLIILLPFTRVVVLTGSLASGHSTPNSDIDLLIIAKSGRLFTARFLSILVTWLTGLKRSSSEDAVRRGHFCLNYYLTDGFLIIPHHRNVELNRYCAENYSKAVFLAGDRAIFNKFMAMNERWMSRYLSGNSEILHISPPALRTQGKRKCAPRTWQKQRSEGRIRHWMEKQLSGKFGQRVENKLKQIQLARIDNDARTKTFPDLIYADDREMRFHPPKSSSTEY